MGKLETLQISGRVVIEVLSESVRYCSIIRIDSVDVQESSVALVFLCFTHIFKRFTLCLLIP